MVGPGARSALQRLNVTTHFGLQINAFKAKVTLDSASIVSQCKSLPFGSVETLMTMERLARSLWHTGILVAL